MYGCGNCGCALEQSTVGRRDTCPKCGAELRACLHCRHFDPNVAKECKEPFTNPPADKASANFCDFFQLGEGRESGNRDNTAAAREAAELLFRGGPKR